MVLSMNNELSLCVSDAINTTVNWITDLGCHYSMPKHLNGHM